MTHLCPKCNTLMSEAILESGGPFCISKNSGKKVGFFGAKKEEISTINSFVCPDCGFIEFYAEEPKKFK